VVYFIRHGQSIANAKSIFARDDILLTKKGEEQIDKAIGLIKKHKIIFDMIFSSDLARAKQTAQLIARGIDFDKSKLNFDSRLREYDVGSMADKLEVDVDSDTLISTQGAEDPRDFMIRVNSFFQEIAKIDKSILVVSHAGVYRMVRVIQEGLDPKMFYDLEAPLNAKLIKLNLGYWAT
jgi:broad specificity phosphatase PhoE